jgi:hypothetical protein
MLMVAALAFSSTVLGRCLLSDNVEVTRSKHLLLGLGVLGSATGISAHFPINYPGLYGVVLLSPVVFARSHSLAVCRDLLNALRGLRTRGTIGTTALDNAIVTLASLYLLIALMPEFAHDALTMHLFVPSQMAYQHQWGFDAATYVWAVMPMLCDWVYSIAYLLAGETAVRMVNCACVLLIAWQVHQLAIRAGANAIASRWASLLFLSTPLVFAESANLFVEGIWTAFVLCATLAVMDLSTSNTAVGIKARASHILVVGAMLGFALATKAVTLNVMLALLVVLLLRYKTWCMLSAVRPILIGLGVLLLVGMMPYATAWHITGNPVFPFFNAIFKSPLWLPINFEATTFSSGVTWETFYAIIFHSNQFIEGRIGAAGFQWLLLPGSVIAVLLWRNKNALYYVLIGLVLLLLVFHATAYLRYVFPCVAFFTAVIALPLSSDRASIKITGTALAGLLVAANLVFLQSATYFGQLVPSALFSQAGRDAYIASRAPIRKLVEAINAINVNQNSVAFFSPPLGAGLKSDAIYAGPGFNALLNSEFADTISEAQLAQALLKHNVEWLIIDPLSVTQARADQLVRLSDPVAEIGQLKLRRFKDDVYRYNQELLLNPTFLNAKSWSLSNASSYDAIRNTLTVNVSTPATQSVAVQPGQHFKYSTVTRCTDKPTQGRNQVNWMDANGRFIDTTIEVFDCAADWATHETKVKAPAGARTAVIYASGHTDTPLEFKSLSFRQ